MQRRINPFLQRESDKDTMGVSLSFVTWSQQAGIETSGMQIGNVSKTGGGGWIYYTLYCYDDIERQCENLYT